jgi:hypothetical protein
MLSTAGPPLPFPMPRPSLCALLLLGICSTAAFSQDPFEIQVYEYITVPRGLWNLETHLNYVAKGTRTFEGPVAPTQRQTHLTFELTRGLTETFELAGYLVTAKRDGANPEFVGWRVRPRWRAPEEWHWPVRFSLSLEAGFPRKVYEENQITLEVRPILEKTFGRFQIDLNPVVGRALKGPGKDEGWDFEPGARFALAVTPRLDLSLEYYGATGPVSDPLPGKEQVHQFFPGGDWQFNDRTVLNFGVGFNANDTGNRLVYKTRLGVMW